MITERSNATPEGDLPKETCTPKTCGCPCRKLCRFVMFLLLLAAIGGGVGYWWFFFRVRNMEAYQTAMQKIQADHRVQEALGQPIEAVNWPLREAVPNARIEDQEIDIRWPIQGPKASAQAHVHQKPMQGKWQTDQLEVTLPGNKRVAIRDTDENDPDAAPLFNAPPKSGDKPDAKQPEKNAPPPDINMPIPEEGPGNEQK
jgi:hypothetical protein